MRQRAYPERPVCRRPMLAVTLNDLIQKVVLRYQGEALVLGDVAGIQDMQIDGVPALQGKAPGVFRQGDRPPRENGFAVLVEPLPHALQDGHFHVL